jgi:hypothetical protein
MAPRLTSKRLQGLVELDSFLDIMTTSGWEGTPYECRKGEDCAPCNNCVSCADREILEAGVKWLGEFINHRLQKKDTPNPTPEP